MQTLFKVKNNILQILNIDYWKSKLTWLAFAKSMVFPTEGMTGVPQPGKIPPPSFFIPLPPNFGFILMYIQFMLILILIDVQYLSKFIFSFEKGSSGQSESSSYSTTQLKNSHPSKISDSFSYWEDNPLPLYTNKMKLLPKFLTEPMYLLEKKIH